MTNIFHLPLEIFIIIQKFSTCDDYHYFLNASKEYLSQIKRQTIYFRLHEGKSEEYVRNKDFQTFLLSKVVNGWKQISLKLPPPYKFVDFPMDLPVHRIVRRVGWTLLEEMQQIAHIENLELKTRTIKDMPPLSKVRSLIFTACPDVEDVRGFGHLTQLELRYILALKDISPLQNIPHLILQNCREVEDFSCLGRGKQIYLHLEECPNLTNVNAFSSVRTLILHSCNNITDISALHGIYDLSLIQCPNIIDISSLGNHHRLHIHQIGENVFVPPSPLIGIEILQHIPHVVLTKCNISDITVLQYAKTVFLSSCDNIVDISPLRNVQSLKIHHCSKIIHLKSVANIPELILIVFDPRKYDLSELCNKKLTIETETKGFDEKSFHFLSNVSEVTINYDCGFSNIFNDLSKYSYFQNIQSLKLWEVYTLRHLNGLGHIPVVSFRACNYLEDISALGKNRSVELIECYAIKDVSSLATVVIVTIRKCPEIKDFSCLNQVPRLKLL